MSRHKRNRSRVRRLTKRNSDSARKIWGVILAALAAAGLLALVIANVRLGGGDAIDMATLCPRAGPTGAFAVLLDVTDPLTPQQQHRLDQLLRQEVQALPVGTRVTFGLVSPDASIRSDTRLKLCKPLQGSQASSLYQNPALVEARYREGFVDPLHNALTDLLAAPAADSSPIMESIQALIIDAFADLRPTQPKRLVIASDLLQHSDVFSFYRGQRWGDFAQSADYGRLARNLDGVDVTLLQLPRPASAGRQDAAMLGFWREYFEHQGAHAVHRVVIGDL
ncbi:MAG: hypothetical protein LJE69_07775 [Thiohalocapsa sp.]|jgi:hypothetical protein|uniref:hypothetical protein n=1 Tax=Thiohalocapsa sp. TaxID=2497641 RepID=UPI0025E89718|nr:hypothetical protein [Thiohalocapsa sp.]MCG6941133.1 hypothetical protein [Thiohalocapsa sp.]